MIYLIEKGRELEFSYNGHKCFISPSETRKKVSVWIDKIEYPFENITNLIESELFDGKSMLEIWDEIEIETLF